MVCDDRPDMRRTLSALLERCGVRVTAAVDDLQGLLHVVGLASVDVAVLTLPVSGSSGLGAVTALRMAAPDCHVVVLSPFEALEESARRAGASSLMGDSDLRALASVVLRVVDGVAAREVAPTGEPAVHTDPLGLGAESSA